MVQAGDIVRASDVGDWTNTQDVGFPVADGTTATSSEVVIFRITVASHLRPRLFTAIASATLDYSQSAGAADLRLYINTTIIGVDRRRGALGFQTHNVAGSLRIPGALEAVVEARIVRAGGSGIVTFDSFAQELAVDWRAIP